MTCHKVGLLSLLLVVHTPGMAQQNPETDAGTRINSLDQVSLQALPRSMRFENLREVLSGEVAVTPGTLQLLKAQGKADQTFNTFGSVFNVSAVFGDAGSGSVPSAQNSIQTQALGMITFESAHFGNTFTDTGHHADFSFGGSIGFYPTMVLENLSGTATIPQPNARPMFQNALHWSLGPNLNVPIYSHGEAGLFADVGQNFLIDQVSSFKQGDATVTAVPVSNGASRSAFFWETGVQARLLNVAISQAHSDKQSFLLPAFQIAAGYRHDSRFNGAGDLAAYDSPDSRFFFRFFISLNNILDQRSTGDPTKPMSFKFGVDYERPISESRIPASTRYIVSADVDILKLFAPSK